MGMDKWIIRLIIVLSLIFILFSLTCCEATNENSPSFEKFEILRKVESFDVDDGRFVILVEHSVNIFDEEGNFLKCVEFENNASSLYAFFTSEGDLAIFRYKSDNLYLLDETTNQFYEAQNVSIDLEELEKSTTQEGVLETVQIGENTFHITIPTFLDFIKGNSSVKITKSSSDNEIVIFDDNGAIYCDYYISLISFFVFGILFIILVIFLIRKFKKQNSK